MPGQMFEIGEVCAEHLSRILDGGKRGLSSQFPGSCQFSWQESEESAGNVGSLPCSPTGAAVAEEDAMHPTGQGAPQHTALCCSRHRCLAELH